MPLINDLEVSQYPTGSFKTEGRLKKDIGQTNIGNFASRRIEFLRKLKYERNQSKNSKDTCLYLAGNDLTIAYLQRHGFTHPIYVPEKEGLGMKIPNPKTFKLVDIRKAIGSRMIMNVTNMFTLKESKMTLKEWQNYFDEKPTNRTATLYLSPIEFSNTKLSHQLVSPRIVRELDWVDKVWPSHLRETKILKSP